ncbi:MAG: hypothetical protein HY706_06440, partial [Candidatus Hydrogenedentes bacterium]|nr:hypothetical protein [Candidatus Hydrogenedentota bacterium]
MWERFTEQARKVVADAHDIAAKFGSDYVRTEHLLLALCREPDSIAVGALRKVEVDAEALARDIEQQTPQGSAAIPSIETQFTPRAKMVLEGAIEEAVRLRHSSTGTEHILLAIVTSAEGITAEYTKKLGIQPERLRAAIIGLLLDRGDGAEPPTSATPAYGIRYSSSAVEVLNTGLREARRLLHKKVEPGHILLGII